MTDLKRFKNIISGEARSIRMLLLTVLCLAVILLFAACGRNEVPGQTQSGQKSGTLFGSGSETGFRYSPVQIYIQLASGRKNISSVYTDTVFDVIVDDEGNTYNDSYLEVMRKYLIKADTMRLMCDDRGIKLTSSEKEEITELSEAYMNELEKCDHAGEITSEDIYQILADRVLMDKLRTEITGESNMEVSESEARIMNVSIMVLSNSEDAEKALARIEKGDDFLKVARESSLEAQIEKRISREDLDSRIVEAVFALEDEQVSPVMEVAGRYYIVKCNKSYDPEATAVHKEKMIRQRVSEAVGREYERYAAEHKTEPVDKLWQEAVEMYDEKPDIPNIFNYVKKQSGK